MKWKSSAVWEFLSQITVDVGGQLWYNLRAVAAGIRPPFRIWLTVGLNWMESKLYQEIRTQQAWPPGTVPVALQSWYGQHVSEKLQSASGYHWVSGEKSGSLQSTLEHVVVPLKGVSAHSWHPAGHPFQQLWLKASVLTTLWPDLTALNGSTLESLQHQAFNRTPTGIKWNEWVPGIQLVPWVSFTQGKE